MLESQLIQRLVGEEEMSREKICEIDGAYLMSLATDGMLYLYVQLIERHGLRSIVRRQMQALDSAEPSRQAEHLITYLDYLMQAQHLLDADTTQDEVKMDIGLIEEVREERVDPRIN